MTHSAYRIFALTFTISAMRAVELHVENFRGIQSAALTCGALTALVGRNGAGKSTFLHALDLFYRPTAAVSLEDFSYRRTDGALVIRVTYEGLQPEELTAFATYIHDGRLIVTKRFQPPAAGATSAGQYFAARKLYLRFSDIRGLAAMKKRTALGELVKSLRDEGLIPSALSFKSETEADTFMAQFEDSHRELLELREDTYQFFGEKNVGGGKLDNFTQFVYVPAVRDAQQETGDRGTSFSQLLDLAVLRRVNAMPEVSSLQQKLRDLVNQTFEPEAVRGDLKTLEADINAVLQPFIPTASLSLDWSGDPEVKYAPPKVIPSLTEDAFSGDISRKGHGLQRALIFALLSHLARVRTVRVDGGTPLQQNDGTAMPPPAPAPGTRRGPDYIIGIEEPELYQHPNRCRHFANVLRRLADEDGADGSATQILFTTHSPYFVSLEHFGDVRVVRKDATDERGLTCTSLTSQSVDHFRAEWAGVCERDPKDITEVSLRLRLQRTMTQFVNEGFFADIVVLVEGLGDIGVLTAVADRKNADWLGKGVTVLSVDGKDNLAAPILIFRALNIPTYFVFDGDKQHDGKGKKKNEDQTKRANRALLRLGGIPLGEGFGGFPDDTVVECFSCFSGRLEDRCREDLGEGVYTTLSEKVAEETGSYAESVLKSTGVAHQFVGAIYADGKALPGIERIVDAITAFAVSVNAHASSPAPLVPTDPRS